MLSRTFDQYISPYMLFATDASSREQELNEELKFVLTIFRERKANSTSHNNNNTQPENWLSQHSTPRDVQAWLAAKGFAEKYVTSILS